MFLFAQAVQSKTHWWMWPVVPHRIKSGFLKHITGLEMAVVLGRPSEVEDKSLLLKYFRHRAQRSWAESDLKTSFLSARFPCTRRYQRFSSLIELNTVSISQVVVAHAFNLRGGRGRWVSDFEANLAYRVSSRTGSKAAQSFKTLSQKAKPKQGSSP